MKVTKYLSITLLVAIYLYFAIIIFNEVHAWLGIAMVIFLVIGGIAVVEKKLKKKQNTKK